MNKLKTVIGLDTSIDREQAFLIFATFTGDVERTAHACNMRAVDVLAMAKDEGWFDRLKPLIEMKKSTVPGDFERAVNRALNFVQAHRMRLFYERIMAKLIAMDDSELDSYIFTEKIGKSGDETRNLKTRPLADLAAALEKCHVMTYQALADTAQDRNRRDEQASGDVNAGELHVQIAQAMTAANASKTPRAALFDAQLAQGMVGQAHVAPAKPDPNNNDDH